MKEFKIYTCGKMSGLTFGQQMSWRLQMQELVNSKTDKRVVFIHPPLYYNYDTQMHKDEREVMDWEINQVCKSDIIVVDLNGIEESIGSHFELGAAIGANITGGRQISIIGVGDVDIEKLHPWIGLSMLRHERTYEDAADYIVGYLLY